MMKSSTSSYHLRDQGVILRHDESMERIEGDDDGVVLHLKSGKRVKTDALLWANGRTGNTDDLGLENLDIVANNRGQIEVDDQFQTVVPHIYAVGDVIGMPSLASAAYTLWTCSSQPYARQCGRKSPHSDCPAGIYTSPEISCVGQTERELTAACVPYGGRPGTIQKSCQSSDHW